MALHASIHPSQEQGRDTERTPGVRPQSSDRNLTRNRVRPGAPGHGQGPPWGPAIQPRTAFPTNVHIAHDMGKVRRQLRLVR